jgi:glycine cleavage system aminomethyltransferase T
MSEPVETSPTSELALEREALRSSAALVRPSQPALFVLSGPDALRFAQGMFTQDLRALDAGRSRESAMVDDEGHLLGLLSVLGLPDRELLCLLHDRDLDWFRARYEIQLLLDDVLVTDLHGRLEVVSVRGPGAESVLRGVGLPVPEADGHHLLQDGIRVVRRSRDGAHGFDLLVPSEQVGARAASLAEAGAKPVGREACHQVRILRGVPALPFDADAETSPHELGIADRVCSFRKGHYLGQSALVRWQGEAPPRQLGGLDLCSGPAPLVGSPVWLNEERVGRSGSVATVDGHSFALALLRQDVAQPGRVLAVGPVPESEPALVSLLPFPQSRS